MQVDRLELLKALNLVGDCIVSRPSHLILKNFLLSFEQDKLRIRGSDLISTTIRTIPATSQTDESFCLPKNLIIPIIERLISDEINFLLEEDVIIIESEEVIIRIPVWDASEFPEMPNKPDNLESFSFPVKELSQAISRVSLVASTEQTKMILCGIHLFGNGEKLELAATNGHCLAVVKINSNLEIKMTVSADPLRQIINNADSDNQEFVNVFCADNKQEIISTFDNFYFSSRKLEGEYPNYQALIPSQFSTQLEVNRKDLLESLKLIAVIGKDSSVSIEWESDQLIICSLSVDVGSVKTKIKCSHISTTGKMAFSLKYLLKAVHFHSSENITINLNDYTSPVIVTGGDDSLFLVMPIHLSNRD